MTSTSQRNAPTGGKPAAVNPARLHHHPLPSATIAPSKPRLGVGFDVHLTSIAAVDQKGSFGLTTPRRLTRENVL